MFVQISNAFLRSTEGDKLQIQLNFIKEMPRTGHKTMLDLSSVGPLLFAWVMQLLLPVSKYFVFSPLFVGHSSSIYETESFDLPSFPYDYITFFIVSSHF